MSQRKKVLSKVEKIVTRYVKKHIERPTVQHILLELKMSSLDMKNLNIQTRDEITKVYNKLEKVVINGRARKLKEENKEFLLKWEKAMLKHISKTKTFPNNVTMSGLFPSAKRGLVLLRTTNPKYIDDFKRKYKSFLAETVIDPVKEEHRKKVVKITRVGIQILRSQHIYPTLEELKKRGISRNMVRSAFGTLNKYHQYLIKNHPQETEGALVRAEQIEEQRREVKDKCCKEYFIIAKKLKRYPRLKDLKDSFVNSGRLNKYFGGLGELKRYCRETYEGEMQDVHDVDDLINDIRLAKVRRNVRKYNRFVISSIGTGKVEARLLNSIYNYCEKNKARLVLIPTEIKFDQIDPFILTEYKEGRLDIAFEEIRLCENLHINSIRINEKVVNPTAGITRYQKNNSSFIYASPKQTVRTIGVKKKGYPRFLISPGAITLPNYMNDPLFRKKRRHMAENDHLLGGIIVEVEGKFFYERQFQMHTDGSFPDFGVRYFPNGEYKIDLPESFIMGDLHSQDKHEHCFSSWLNIIKSLKIKNTVLHDVFDAKTINPHEKMRMTKTLSLALENEDNLGDELSLLVEDIKRVSGVTSNTYIVDSNHDDMLQRAFDSGLIWKNPKNAVIGSLLYPYSLINNLKDDYTNHQIVKMISNTTKISKDVLEKNFPMVKNPRGILEQACEFYGLEAGKNNIKFLNLESSLNFGGFEVSDHGHKGTNGAKGSPISSAQSFVKRITGHTHVEYQFNYVISVGHTTGNPHYARGGMSGWSRCSAITYKSGQFQSLRYVNGRIRCTKDAFIPKEVNYKDLKSHKRKEA